MRPNQYSAARRSASPRSTRDSNSNSSLTVERNLSSGVSKFDRTSREYSDPDRLDDDVIDFRETTGRSDSRGRRIEASRDDFRRPASNTGRSGQYSSQSVRPSSASVGRFESATARGDRLSEERRRTVSSEAVSPQTTNRAAAQTFSLKAAFQTPESSPQTTNRAATQTFPLKSTSQTPESSPHSNCSASKKKSRSSVGILYRVSRSLIWLFFLTVGFWAIYGVSLEARLNFWAALFQEEIQTISQTISTNEAFPFAGVSRNE